VRVLVYRDGPMGHLGHNHVIAVRSLSGTVALAGDVEQSRFELSFPVDGLSVDEASLRAEEGADFSTTLDEAAIAGTREHMLGIALLNATSYPTIHLQSQQLRQAADGVHITTAMTVRTVTAEVDVPVNNWHADGHELQISGEFDLTHAQLGLTPYSVALGALRVAERMHVRYRLVASRVTS
jgi:polyisoprenoid-binding protein YceI